MRILLDTNILLRLDDKSHRQHADVQSAIELLGKSGHEMVLVPQVISEIITHNATDFSRFGAIRVWTPNDILSGQFPV